MGLPPQKKKKSAIAFLFVVKTENFEKTNRIKRIKDRCISYGTETMHLHTNKSIRGALGLCGPIYILKDYLLYILSTQSRQSAQTEDL